jgi:hypothetical protein
MSLMNGNWVRKIELEKKKIFTKIIRIKSSDRYQKKLVDRKY